MTLAPLAGREFNAEHALKSEDWPLSFRAAHRRTEEGRISCRSLYGELFDKDLLGLEGGELQFQPCGVFVETTQ
jgi:hypothetical protein